MWSIYVLNTICGFKNRHLVFSTHNASPEPYSVWSSWSFHMNFTLWQPKLFWFHNFFWFWNILIIQGSKVTVIFNWKGVISFWRKSIFIWQVPVSFKSLHYFFKPCKVKVLHILNKIQRALCRHSNIEDIGKKC